MKDSQTKQVEQPAKNEPTPVKGDDAERKFTLHDIKSAILYGADLANKFCGLPSELGNYLDLEWDEYLAKMNTKAAPKGDDVISKEDATVCVFCDAVCEPSPTKRGWASVGKYKKGLHFDCAKKVASLDKSAPQAVKWVQASELIKRLIELTPYHINPYNLGEMGEISSIIGKLKKLVEGSTDKNETNANRG